MNRGREVSAGSGGGADQLDLDALLAELEAEQLRAVEAEANGSPPRADDGSQKAGSRIFERGDRPPGAEPGTLTLAQLVRSTGRGKGTLRLVLDDEVRRGHLERAGDGWRATPLLLDRHGPAFRAMGATS